MHRLGTAAVFSLSLVATSGSHAQEASDLLKEQYAAVCSDMFAGTVTGERDISNLATDSVLQRIAADADDSSYTALIPELGQTSALSISDVVHLSYGDVFVCRFQHEKGASLWQIGYSPISQLIEDFEMVVVRDEPKPKPKPATDERSSQRDGGSTTRGGEVHAPAEMQQTEEQPASETSASERPDIVPETPTQSEACKMFPDLC